MIGELLPTMGVHDRGIQGGDVSLMLVDLVLKRINLSIQPISNGSGSAIGNSSNEVINFALGGGNGSFMLLNGLFGIGGGGRCDKIANG